MASIFAIGDIHGESDLLAAMLARIEPLVTSGDQIVLLGDYVDRGPDVRGVIDMVIQLTARFPGQVICLEGNHEERMKAWFDRPSLFWLDEMKGWSTLESYDADAVARFRRILRLGTDLEGALGALASAARDAIPPSHGDFLERLVLCHEVDGYLFAHAGVNPWIPLDQQRPRDYLWTDWKDLIEGWKGPPTLVVGHTPTYKIQASARGRPICREHLVFLDTGCVRTGILSAMRFPEEELIQATRRSGPS